MLLITSSKPCGDCVHEIHLNNPRYLREKITCKEEQAPYPPIAEKGQLRKKKKFRQYYHLYAKKLELTAQRTLM